MSEKLCIKCGSPGPFEKDRSKADGLSCRCKACKKVYREANSVARAASSKAWREANPDKAKAVADSWRNRNVAAVKGLAAAYYREHKEQFKHYYRTAYADRREGI